MKLSFAIACLLVAAPVAASPMLVNCRCVPIEPPVVLVEVPPVGELVPDLLSDEEERAEWEADRLYEPAAGRPAFVRICDVLDPHHPQPHDGPPHGPMPGQPVPPWQDEPEPPVECVADCAPSVPICVGCVPPASVPEPVSLSLFGLAVLFGGRRFRR